MASVWRNGAVALPPVPLFALATFLLLASVGPAAADSAGSVMGGSRRLARAADTVCTAGYHPCSDIGHDSLCCPNDQYCYVAPTNLPRCCSLGLLCDSACDSDHYQCNANVTRTLSVLVTTSDPSVGITSQLTTVTSSSVACCGRACTQTSFFLCGVSAGGHCCPYGAPCGSSAPCSSTAAIVAPISTLANIGDSSAPQTTPPTNGSSAGVGGGGGPGKAGGNSGGLSDAARGGISAGAVVAAGLIAGLVVCLWRSRRRRAVKRSQTVSKDDLAVSDALVNPPKRSGAPQRVDSSERPIPSDGPYSFDPTFAPNADNAVPGNPDRPADITQAYEIDSRPNIAPTGTVNLDESTGYTPTPGSEPGGSPLHLLPSSLSIFDRKPIDDREHRPSAQEAMYEVDSWPSPSVSSPRLGQDTPYQIG